MDCFVCAGKMSPFFSKDFGGRFGLDTVDYCKCDSCGMVISKTHFEMSLEEWEKLNEAFHSSFLGTSACDEDPRWLERLEAQATTISELTDIGILPSPTDELPWVDYACGDGKLIDLLGSKELKALKYERYCVNGEAYLSEKELIDKKYGLVLNTSVFEHLRELKQFDAIVDLVDERGFFALHTLVCESIPRDPSWFYLLPVHCTFFTNRAMQILFERWNFEYSIYGVESRMWFLSRNNAKDVERILEQKKSTLNGEFCFKNAFVDFWK